MDQGQPCVQWHTTQLITITHLTNNHKSANTVSSILGPYIGLDEPGKKENKSVPIGSHFHDWTIATNIAMTPTLSDIIHPSTFQIKVEDIYVGSHDVRGTTSVWGVTWWNVWLLKQAFCSHSSIPLTLTLNLCSEQACIVLEQRQIKYLEHSSPH